MSLGSLDGDKGSTADVWCDRPPGGELDDWIAWTSALRADQALKCSKWGLSVGLEETAEQMACITLLSDYGVDLELPVGWRSRPLHEMHLPAKIAFKFKEELHSLPLMEKEGRGRAPSPSMALPFADATAIKPAATDRGASDRSASQESKNCKVQLFAPRGCARLYARNGWLEGALGKARAAALIGKADC